MTRQARLDALARLLTERPGRVVVAAVALGFVLRLAFGFGYWVGKPLTHDEVEYLTLAANLAAGRGFTYGDTAPTDAPTIERFSRPPLYPLLIAIVARGPLVEGDRNATIRRVKIAQAAVGALGVALVAGLARVGGPRAASLAALLAASYPPLVWMPAYVLSETLYSTLALASALLLLQARRPGRSRAAPHPDRPGTAAPFWAGVLAGAAALTRSIGLAFIALVVFWLAARRSGRGALAFVAGAALVIAPWSLRTSFVHGRPILVAADGGVNFWVGNHPLARGEGDLAANPLIKEAHLAFRRRYPDRTPEQLEPLYYREAARTIAQRPLWWLTLLARKIFYAWVPIGPSYTLHSTRYVVTSLVSYGALLPVGLAGAVLLVRRHTPPAPVFLLAGSTLLGEVIFFPQERYRIPVIDPTLIVCAAAWIAARWDSPARTGCATSS